MDNENVKVSVIVPVYNEAGYIENCINSLLNNDYPSELVEIIIVDGLSCDESPEIIRKLTTTHKNIKAVENKKKIFPSAVNIGYSESKGDVIIIAGAHAVYDKSYISLSVKYLYELDAQNVGGVLITEAQDNGLMARVITTVLSNPFGVGNSTFRTGTDKIMETDTVFGGCYKREVFENIGLFNENLISTSDMEFNTRLRKSGGKIYIIPQVKVRYFTRSRFGKFFKNNFRNGYWVIYPVRYTKNIVVSLRHLIPLVFMSAITGGIILSLIFPFLWWIMAGAGFVYFTTGFVYALKSLNKNTWYYIPVLPLMFFMLHLSYGSASMYGVVKLLFLKISGR